MFEMLFLLALGFGFGFKHAFDADHLAAVALLTSQSKSIKHSLVRSIYWGVGHTAALLFAGFLILGFKIYFPEAAVHFLDFFVGLVHGFAGSAALLLLVLGTLQSVFWEIVYVLIFGLGATTGMAIVGAVIGLSTERIKKHLNLSAGVFSVGLGLFMMTVTTIF